MIFAATVYLLKKITGQDDTKPPPSIEDLVNKRPGDIDALSSSIISPAKRAHTIINHGANIININGDNNSVVFNNRTKEYLYHTESHSDENWIDASIGWLNGNQNTGGAYIYELGRIVPFDISRSASYETREALSRSHADYFLRNADKSRRNADKSRIAIRVIKKTDMNGVIKRYILLEASPIDQEQL